MCEMCEIAIITVWNIDNNHMCELDDNCMQNSDSNYTYVESKNW